MKERMRISSGYCCVESAIILKTCLKLSRNFLSYMTTL